MLIYFLIYILIMVAICLSAPVCLWLICGLLRLIPSVRKIIDAPAEAYTDGAA